MVITFDKVSFKYIERKIIDNASFSITDNDKIGLVGINGIGKTTLLKLIMGIEKENSGEIIKSGGMIINYLEQDPIFPNDISLLDIVMQASTVDHPINDYEAKSILSKLGLNDYDMYANNLSGGQRKRLALCKVLVSYCDLLILDEPTNHLDTELILWLEKYLIKFKKSLLMVTHDRYFLQRVCNKMMELDMGKIYTYEANYEKFLELKAERLEQADKFKRKIQSILKNEAEWMNRSVEARRTKSKSRIQRFNELSQIEFNETKEMEFSSITQRLGKKLISMKNLSKSFGDLELFSNFTFDLQRNDIIGVVGGNGCGKSTFFKIIMGIEKPSSGELVLGETLKIGYFSQHLELIDPEIRVIDYIKNQQSLIETLDGVISVSDLLEQFMFPATLQYSKVKMLSGGEKRRLQLVKVLINNPNILLFDEPTNDLDLYTLEILENYLLSFKGPILVVSHDRYFLDKICNKLLIFKNKEIIESNKSFSEYLEEDDGIDNNSNANKNNTNQGYKNKNKMPSNLRNELQRLEEELPRLEDEAKELASELKKQTTDFHKMMELQEKLDFLSNVISEKTDRYFELLEIKESYTI